MRKTAAALAKPWLWGESGPTADHPELVLEVGDVVSVVSFRRTPKLVARRTAKRDSPQMTGLVESVGRSDHFSPR